MIIVTIVAKDKEEAIFILSNVLGIKIVMKKNSLNFLNIVKKFWPDENKVYDMLLCNFYF